MSRYKGESSHVVPSKKMKKDDATSNDGNEGRETVNLEISNESDFQEEEETPDTEVEMVCENVSEVTPEKEKKAILKMSAAQKTILKGKKVVGENYSPIVVEKVVKEKSSNQEMPPLVIPPSPSSVDVIVDDSKLMELMDIAMSSARKGKKGESSTSTEFSGSPVDKLIVEVRYLCI
ncbi:hypothetical protein ACFE04_024629 [Oxalis oulophora]